LRGLGADGVGSDHVDLSRVEGAHQGGVVRVASDLDAGDRRRRAGEERVRFEGGVVFDDELRDAVRPRGGDDVGPAIEADSLEPAALELGFQRVTRGGGDALERRGDPVFEADDE